MRKRATAAAVLAATVCAGRPLMADCSEIAGIARLPATVSAEERQQVETAVGSAVHEVVFVRSARTLIPGLRRRDVEVLAPFDEITHVLVPSTQSGPRIPVELGGKGRL